MLRIACVIIIGLCAESSMAQKYFFIKGGININMLPLRFESVGTNVSPLNYELASNVGPHVGVFVNLPLNNGFSFQPGINLIGRDGGKGERH